MVISSTQTGLVYREIAAAIKWKKYCLGGCDEARNFNLNLKFSISNYRVKHGKERRIPAGERERKL